MGSKHSNAPEVGDKVVVMGPSTEGPIIERFGILMGTGYAFKTWGKTKPAALTHNPDEFWWSITGLNVIEAPRFSIIAFPRYDRDDGSVKWGLSSHHTSDVVLDRAALRELDAESRAKTRARKLGEAIKNCEYGMETDMALKTVQQFFGLERWERMPDIEDIAAMLVAANLVPPIDFDAELQRRVFKATREFTANYTNNLPLDF